jgi:CheY-like chemotaxis protein
VPKHQVCVLMNFGVLADHDPVVVGILPRIPRTHRTPSNTKIHRQELSAQYQLLRISIFWTVWHPSPVPESRAEREVTETPTLRVLVVDDSEAVRRAIRQLLRSQPDIDVVCEASDGPDAIHKTWEHRPDVVLMDLAMPGMNGLDVTRRIKDELPSTKILALSQMSPDIFARFTIAAGAIDYIFKNNAAKELIPALRKIQSRR